METGAVHPTFGTCAGKEAGARGGPRLLNGVVWSHTHATLTAVVNYDTLNSTRWDTRIGGAVDERRAGSIEYHVWLLRRARVTPAPRLLFSIHTSSIATTGTADNTVLGVDEPVPG